MKLISERSINRTLKTIDGRGKKIEFPHKFDDNLIVTGPWNMNNFMILDIIADLIIRKFYYKKEHIPINPYDPIVIERASKLTKETLKFVDSTSSISNIFIKDKELFMSYKFLLDYNSNQIYDMLKSAADCKFKIIYPVRIYNPETKRYEVENYNNFENGFESLFDLEITNENRVGKKLFGLSYKISFNSCLSRLFVYNVLAVNYDWINIEMYSSNNMAQLIYRKYILTNHKRKEYIIPYDDFNKVLGLNISNITVAKKKIEKGLEVLRTSGKIDSWKFGVKCRRDLTYYEIHNKINKKN